MIRDEFSHIQPASKRWRLRHPGKQAEYNAKWRKEHPNYQKEWDAKNPEKLKEYNENWNRLNPERRKEIQRKHDLKRGHHYTQGPKRTTIHMRVKAKDLREKVFDMYGHVCVRCGFTDKRALQLDHINSDGADHRRSKSGKQHTGSFKVWKDAISEYRPDRYQILCANCNWIKRSEEHECNKKSKASAAHA